MNLQEMMLKRNFQISNQTLNQVESQLQEFEKPGNNHNFIMVKK